MGEYKIEMTPLISETETSYGDTIDITEYVENSGLSNIKRDVDQGDFEVGVFNYGSIKLRINNKTGKFNEIENDGKSIFPVMRDRSIIEVTYIDDDDAETQSFKGLISDKATRQDIDNQTITFTALSLDSIFGTVIVKKRSITNGITYSKAFEIILNVKKITDFMNYDASDINPALDLIIDNGSVFDNATTKTALDELLFASGSILLIDSNDDIIIRSRAENSNTPHDLFLNDQYRRDNIKSIKNYNNGLQRMYNYAVINDVVSKNTIVINKYGERKIEKTFDFITNDTNNALIADSLVDDFGIPAQELTVEIDIDISKDMAIFDKVTLDIQPSITPKNGIAPLYEYEQYDIAEYPIENSELKINPGKIFKIIEFDESTGKYRTNIKLRDTGTYI